MINWEYVRDQLGEAHAHLLEVQMELVKDQEGATLQHAVEVLENALVDWIRDIEDDNETRTAFGKPRRTLS